MRVVVQRCKNSSVTVDGAVTGAIGEGLLLLVGVTHEDTEKDAKYLADKVAGLRIFEDDAGKMNHSVTEAAGPFCPSPNSHCTGTAARADAPTSWRQRLRLRQSGFTTTSTRCCVPEGYRLRPACSER